MFVVNLILGNKSGCKENLDSLSKMEGPILQGFVKVLQAAYEGVFWKNSMKLRKALELYEIPNNKGFVQSEWIVMGTKDDKRIAFIPFLHSRIREFEGKTY
jgi:hypothetical protein